MKYEKVALIGIGNIMYYDEGLGAYLVKYIEENFDTSSNLEIVEGGTLGFTLMTYYQEYDKIIIVGTSSKDEKIGYISCENAQEVMANSPTRKTANEVEITMMIEICSFHEDMGEVSLITMVPENIIDVKNGLSNSVISCMPRLVEKTLKELEISGITAKRKEKEVLLEKILFDYANPKMSDFNNMNMVDK